MSPCEEDDCGPREEGSEELCSDGRSWVDLDSCERQADGVCRWIWEECPSCEPGDAWPHVDGCSECHCDETGAPVCVVKDCGKGGCEGLLESECESRNLCRWVPPACEDLAPLEAVGGCYSVQECVPQGGDCGAGSGCEPIVHSPCLDDGPPCDDCEEEFWTCVCELLCENGRKRDVDGGEYCECRDEHGCGEESPPAHRWDENGPCLFFPTWCDVPNGWMVCDE